MLRLRESLADAEDTAVTEHGIKIFNKLAFKHFTVVLYCDILIVKISDNSLACGEPESFWIIRVTAHNQPPLSLFSASV